MHGKELNKIENFKDKELTRQKFEDQYESDFLNPFTAVEHGYIDSIIEPTNIRQNLQKALDFTENKVEKLPPKKHGNSPL